MGYYYIPTTGQVTQIDNDTYAMWVETDNPKAQYYVPIPDPPGPGYTWNGTEWVAPPVYVPQQVTAFQGRAQLMNIGLLTQAESIVVASTDQMLKLAWTHAIYWDRNSPMLQSMGTALGMSSQDLDDLFIAAAQISV